MSSKVDKTTSEEDARIGTINDPIETNNMMPVPSWKDVVDIKRNKSKKRQTNNKGLKIPNARDQVQYGKIMKKPVGSSSSKAGKMVDSSSLNVLNKTEEMRSSPGKSAKSLESIQTLKSPHSHGSSKKHKFKRKSDFESLSSLNQILESKSRISINGSTGQYDFVYQNQFKTDDRGNLVIVPRASEKRSE
jgi:hypothetical protein